MPKEQGISMIAYIRAMEVVPQSIPIPIVLRK